MCCRPVHGARWLKHGIEVRVIHYSSAKVCDAANYMQATTETTQSFP